MNTPDGHTLHSDRSRIASGHLALAAAQIGFGLFPVFGTLVFAAGGVSPLGVGSWRIGAGALILGAITFAIHGRAALPERKDIPRLLWCALLGVVVNQGLFLVGLSRSTPMNAGLVMSMIPVFTFAIAAAVRQERFSALRAAGVLIALVGMVPLLFGNGGGTRILAQYGPGNLLMVGNALSYSIYLVISKPLTRRYPALVILAWNYLLSLLALPYFAAGEKLIPDPGFTAAWWSLAYIIAFPTVISYLLAMFGLARVRASTTAIYVYSQPLIAGVASWFAFGEKPTAAMLVAAVALFIGIWLVARRPPHPELPDPKSA
jgi:drug/metabolite transporter (DMT)-like permease